MTLSHLDFTSKLPLKRNKHFYLSRVVGLCLLSVHISVCPKTRVQL